ncbi:hypothetical protein HDU67_002065 [Dinochytrium kinnereticum]|nr:hypothetical protein HDU67_002065 [Dinochytrium kinnereticum]
MSVKHCNEDDLDELLQELNDHQHSHHQQQSRSPKRSHTLPAELSSSRPASSRAQPKVSTTKAVEATRSVDELIAELNMLVEDDGTGKNQRSFQSQQMSGRGGDTRGASSGMAGIIPDSMIANRESPMMAPSPSKRKCSPPCVGGADDEVGLTLAVASSPGMKFSSPASWKSCDKLRCLSCDFKCLTFHGTVWSPRADYLFFRNHMPDGNKLGKNLQRKEGEE